MESTTQGTAVQGHAQTYNAAGGAGPPGTETLDLFNQIQAFNANAITALNRLEESQSLPAYQNAARYVLSQLQQQQTLIRGLITTWQGEMVGAGGFKT